MGPKLLEKGHPSVGTRSLDQIKKKGFDGKKKVSEIKKAKKRSRELGLSELGKKLKSRRMGKGCKKIPSEKERKSISKERD